MYFVGVHWIPDLALRSDRRSIRRDTRYQIFIIIQSNFRLDTLSGALLLFWVRNIFVIRSITINMSNTVVRTLQDYPRHLKIKTINRPFLILSVFHGLKFLFFRLITLVYEIGNIVNSQTQVRSRAGTISFFLRERNISTHWYHFNVIFIWLLTLHCFYSFILVMMEFMENYNSTFHVKVILDDWTTQSMYIPAKHVRLGGDLLPGFLNIRMIKLRLWAEQSSWVTGELNSQIKKKII